MNRHKEMMNDLIERCKDSTDDDEDLVESETPEEQLTPEEERRALIEKHILALDFITSKYWTPGLVKTKPGTYVAAMKGWLNDAIEDALKAQKESKKELPSYNELRAKAIKRYGDNPHSFGGQRDGFIVGFEHCYEYLKANKEVKQPEEKEHIDYGTALEMKTKEWAHKAGLTLPNAIQPQYNNQSCKEGCNCIEIAEHNNGGNPVKNYECLGDSIKSKAEEKEDIKFQEHIKTLQTFNPYYNSDTSEIKESKEEQPKGKECFNCSCIPVEKYSPYCSARCQSYWGE